MDRDISLNIIEDKEREVEELLYQLSRDHSLLYTSEK
jgi:hypothetical protein